jgi:hypothetical protein
MELTIELMKGIAALATAGGVIYNIWQSRQIKHLTNSMKDELVAEVKKGSLAEGLKQGRDEAKSDAMVRDTDRANN